MKIAVLLATFNRREKTISCLHSLYNQELPVEIQVEVFLTDDASSDGTADAVKSDFPKVHLLQGSGSLFWAGGMRNTWREALKANFDYYLLLNDDTLLKPDVVNKLIIQSVIEPKAICVGSTSDSEGKISYGGRRLYSKSKVHSFNVFSDTEVMECDLANANIMLVPAAVVKAIGILSERFTHSMADFDYTLRAIKAGFKVLVLPGVQGYCIDDHGNNWKSAKVSFADRMKYLKSPKGIAYSEYMYFIRQHFPMHLPETFVKLWAKTLFPVLWDKFKVHQA